MREYLAYARANINPRLSPQASQALIDRYLDMRRQGAAKGQVCLYAVILRQKARRCPHTRVNWRVSFDCRKRVPRFD
jgi:hypothetical protein